VLAYVLMSNHFHLLLTTPKANLSEFMRHFTICYTAAFNRRHNRVGHLYQGRYKAFLIDADNYLLEVSRYIHLNPIRVHGVGDLPVEEKWQKLLRYEASSLAGYFDRGKRKGFVDYEPVLGRLGASEGKGMQQYRMLIREGIGPKGESPLEIGKGTGIIGKGAFVEWVKGKMMDTGGTSEREQLSLRKLHTLYDPEVLIDRFCQIIGKRKEDLCSRGRHSRERAMLMELLYRYSRIRQAEIGRLVGGIDYSSVSQARKRFQLLLAQEPSEKKMFATLCAELEQLSRSKI